MKQKTRQTQETEKRRTHKSQAFWRFFLRGETAKSVRTRRRCCFSRRRGRKKSKLLGWRSDTKGTSIPPHPGEGVERLSPRAPFCPPFSGGALPLGGAVAPPLTISGHPLAPLRLLLPPLLLLLLPPPFLVQVLPEGPCEVVWNLAEAGVECVCVGGCLVWSVSLLSFVLVCGVCVWCGGFVPGLQGRVA